ncbi:MAG: ABC transporter permease [Acidobacteria bacterium]|nr:ABC transporter permease [Acidobacteriota bacterium]
MRSLLQDLKFSGKLLLKDKAFNLIALLTLALCIGANSAIFTVLHSVILRPLPFADSERLVILYNRYPGVGVNKGSNGIPDYLDRKKETGVFEELALIDFLGFDVGMESSPERVPAQRVTPSYFRMLRVSPLKGRLFTEDEAVQGKDKVVILSYGLWKQMYAGRPDAVGQDVRLSGTPYRIVGVMPEGFEFVSRTVRMWTPFAFTPEQTSDNARHNNSWTMVGRLKPGVPLSLAQQKIDALNQRNLDLFPQYKQLLVNARFNTKVAFFLEEITEDIRPTLYLLQGAVIFVLLIGCVNVANLMLVRSNVRMKEFAIRFSMGAGRARLGRQLLTESLTLAVLGGLLGALVGYWGVRLLNYLGAGELPRGTQIRMDGTVFAFTLAVAAGAGVFFGLVPVVHLMRRNLLDVFRQTERTGTVEKRALLTCSVLVVCQVALAFVLLIGAGLMTMSFLRVMKVDPGFRPQNVTTARVSLPQTRYEGSTKRRGFMERLVERSRGLPGVRAAGITTYLPFSGNNNASVIEIVGYARGPGENPPVPGWNAVSGDYFRAMTIPLLRGRSFQDSDTQDSELVCIIDQFLARKYWPNGNQIGAKIRRGIAIGRDQPPPVLTVVGVVGSVKTSDLAEQNPVGQIYFHYKQYPPGSVHLVLAGERAETQVVGAARAELRRLDPELPLSDGKTMEQRLAESLVARRAPMVLCLIFAGLALFLAAIGLYGVLAYAVTQRTRELGIRMALGARSGDVLHMVLWQGVRLAAIGLALGAAGAYALTRVMASLLYEVKPGDPAVFLLVAVVLGGVALVAAAAPSLRATRISPVVALRYE